MNFLPRWIILSAFSALALVGCHRPPTQEEISARAAELLAEQLASKQAGAEEPAVEPSEADQDLLDETNAALDRIIIPRVEFRDVTLREAVHLLQQRAIEIARESTDLAIDTSYAEWKKAQAAAGRAWTKSSDRPFALDGLRFFVKHDGFVVPPQYVPLGESPVIPSLEVQPPEDQTITLDLPNISLREALQYCATLHNLEIKVQPGVVVFEPIN